MSFCRDVQTRHILSSPWEWALDHRIIQVGRDLRRSLVQTSAQRRDRHAVRWGSSGLYSARFWKPPAMENCTTSLGNLFQCLTVLIGKEFFLIASLNFFCFHLWPLFLVLLPHTTVQSSAPSSSWSSCRYWQASILSPWSCLFWLNTPHSLSLSS